MSLSTGYGSDPAAGDEGGAIRLGQSQAERRATSWGLMLVVYMRVLAALWIVQGLVEWYAVLQPERSLFDQAPAFACAAISFFAVLDLVAAVGLWLATPWGGVLWLFAATTQIFVGVAVRGFFTDLWIAIDLGLIVAYFVLTFQAGRDVGMHR